MCLDTLDRKSSGSCLQIQERQPVQKPRRTSPSKTSGRLVWMECLLYQDWLLGLSVHEQVKIYIYACIYTFAHIDNIYKGGQKCDYQLLSIPVTRQVAGIVWKGLQPNDYSLVLDERKNQYQLLTRRLVSLRRRQCGKAAGAVTVYSHYLNFSLSHGYILGLRNKFLMEGIKLFMMTIYMPEGRTSSHE